MTTLETAFTDSRVTGSTAAEKLAALLADGSPIVDRTLYTWDKVYKVIGEEKTRTLIQVFKGAMQQDPFLEPQWLKLAVGRDFSDSDFQAKIPPLCAAAGFTDHETALVTGIGVTPQKLWKNLGIESEPTEEQVAEAMEKKAVSEWWAQVANELVPPMITAGKSIEEIKSAIEAS